MKVRYGAHVGELLPYSRFEICGIRKISGFILIATLTFLCGIPYLDIAPPLWWDEGWTVSVAKNWIELGHYGRLQTGEFARRGLEAAFPVTASVALAFKYLGIGVFQARVVILVYLLGALSLLFYLTARIYGTRIGLAALVVLLLMSGSRYMHPVFMGRQVLAEVPVLFFLMAALVCLLLAGEKSRLYLSGGIFFGSLAIITKAQVLPFWIVSLSAPLAICLFRRQWPEVRLFGLGLCGSVLLAHFWMVFLNYYAPPPLSVSGLVSVIGLVLDPLRRLLTLVTTLQVGLPTLLGLVWAFDKVKTEQAWRSHTGLVIIALFVLAGSWFAWWELASTGWPRYLFPPAFLASIFVAAMLYEWTDGFRIVSFVRRISTETQLRKSRMAAAVFLIGWSCVQTVTDLAEAVIGKTNQPLIETAAYLNHQTPASSIVETYESELFFFLKRRYHFPPDQLHVELIRREDLSEMVHIDYDLLSADPDYLVIGGWCRYYKCYESILSRTNFKLVKAFGPYEVFERVRNAVHPY